MKKHLYPLALSFIFISISITGCKTTQKSTDNKTVRNLPTSFNGTKDSSNAAAVNWKVFFKDTSLVALIDTALRNNFDVLKAFQRIEASRANLRLTKGYLFPTVGANASAAQRRYGLYTMDGAGNSTTEITPGQIVPTNLQDYYVSLQTTWEVDLWGKLRNRKHASANRLLGTIESRNFIITNIISDVANSFYELQALDNQLAIIREMIRLQEAALIVVTTQKQAGIATELAVKQFEGQLFNSRTMEKEVLQEILETESRLNFLLGRFPQSIQRNRVTYKNALPFQVSTGIPSDLLRNRPDIRQAEYELHASKADVKAARAAFYPSLNIVGAFGFQAFQTNFWFKSPESMAYTIFGGLTAPLLNRNVIKSEFLTANAVQREALYNYQQSIINGYVEVYNEMAKLRRLQEIHELRNSESEVLLQSVEISSELFRNGRASYLEVLIAQKNALDAQLQLVDARKRQYFALTNIYKALGGGWQ